MSDYSVLILAHGSLRWYARLGESSGTTLDDVGPNNLDGTYGGGFTLGVAGAIVNDADTAVTFNGTTGFGSRTDDSALDLGDGPYSLECWAKRSATQGAAQTLITKTASGGYLLLFTAANKVGLGVVGSAAPATSSVTITDTTTWHHLVVTKNGSARAVYVDGVDVTSLGTNATVTDNASALQVGNTFPGSLDEVAIYGAVLTPSEVLNHYEVGSGIIKLAANSAGVGTAIGDLLIGRPLAGTSAGQGTASADLTVAHPLEGTSAGTGTAIGDVTVSWMLEGTSAGTGTAEGDLVLVIPLEGTSAGAGTASADLDVVVPLEGSSAGTSSAAGDVTVFWALAGASTGTGTATATLTGAWALLGTAAGTGTASGTLTTGAQRWDLVAETNWPADDDSKWPADDDSKWATVASGRWPYDTDGNW